MLSRVTLMVALSLAFIGCGSSHSTEDENDAGISFDGEIPDGAVTADAGDSAVVPRDSAVVPDAAMGADCGNGEVEAGESCDDMNDDDTDACGNDCQWNVYCGNDRTDPGEACDDGNAFSGDGCSADCKSLEICGNGIIDYVTGEVCDDEDTCAVDCLSVVGCGDGTTVAPETCDDENTSRWDGCGADCRTERAMIVNTLSVGDGTVGCDYTGDGRPDNAFGAALPLIRPLLNSQIMMQITNGSLNVLLSPMGLDDATAQNDDSIRLGWMEGARTGTAGQFNVTAASLDASGMPLTSFFGSITSGALKAGPEDFFLTLGLPFPLELKRGQIEGTMASSSGNLSISGARVCGAISVRMLETTPNFFATLGVGIGENPPCVGEADATLADVIIGGTGGSGLLSIPATAPDVDVDGDGLERFETTTTWSGTGACQPVVTACIDGDGTRIEGRGCALDARFADGISIGLSASAVSAQIVGVE